MRIALKAFGLLFLLYLGLVLWFPIVSILAPTAAPPPGNFASVQEQLQGLAEAERAGPEALAAFKERLERSKPFDNTLVIAYTLPLFLVWLICAVGQAREITPLAFVGALWLLWFAAAALAEALLLLAPHAGGLRDFAEWLAANLSDWSFYRLVGFLISIALGVAWRSPGLVGKWVIGGPRLVDGALRALVDEDEGWIAPRFGAPAARAAHLVLILALTGIASWALWQACDGVDGGGLPGAFGLVARVSAVALGASMMLRAHLRA